MYVHVKENICIQTFDHSNLKIILLFILLLLVFYFVNTRLITAPYFIDLFRDARWWNSRWWATWPAIEHQNFTRTFTRLRIHYEIDWKVAYGIPYTPIYTITQRLRFVPWFLQQPYFLLRLQIFEPGETNNFAKSNFYFSWTFRSEVHDHTFMLSTKLSTWQIIGNAGDSFYFLALFKLHLIRFNMIVILRFTVGLP